jgi:FtsH-binding integral membrane protein
VSKEHSVNVVLEAAGSLIAATGIAVCLFRRPLPWLAGQTARPVLWGLGFALLGACVVLMGAFHRQPAGVRLIAPLLLLPAALPLMLAGSGAAPFRRRR